MASIRQIKDDINQQSFELINECFSHKKINPERSEEIDRIIKDLIRMRNELIKRSNHPENQDPKALREHYRKIRQDLGKLSELAQKLVK